MYNSSLPHHCGVPAADEVSDLVEDAFTADGFVQRAALHDDGHSQQDLLTDVLLQTGGKQARSSQTNSIGTRTSCRAVVLYCISIIGVINVK